MSKYANVTLIPTVGPDQECRSFKLGMGPAGICKRNFHLSTDSNWFIASHGNFNRGDAMILIWYDGITCFIKPNTGYIVEINHEKYGMDIKKNIKDGDTIQVNDCWNAEAAEIVLQVTIYYGEEQISRNMDPGNNRSENKKQNIRHRPASQKQIPPTLSSSNSVPRLKQTWQKSLENPILKGNHVKTGNRQLTSFNRDSNQAGNVASKIAIFENNGRCESKKRYNSSLGNEDPRSQKDPKKSKSNAHDVTNSSNKKCTDSQSKVGNKKTHQGVEKTSNQRNILSSETYRDVGGNTLSETTGYEMEQSNTQQEVRQTTDTFENVQMQPPTSVDPSSYNTMYFENHSNSNNVNINQGIQIKGVSNMGLTCYANGIFQILAQTELFLMNIMPVVEMRNKPLTFSLWKILEGINHQSQYCPVNRKVVQKLLDIISEDSSFSKYQQDDCLEFLMHILERLKKENHQSTSMFEMNFQTVLEHEAHPYPHVEMCDTQLSFHLLVPFYQEHKRSNPTVESGLNKMLNVVECFSGEELPCRFCTSSEASRQSISKHFVVSRAPSILILQIGRVENIKFETYSNLKKNNELVEYGQSLSIYEVHWEGYRRTSEEVSYKLYGVVLHSGNIECGHYYCYVKHRNTLEWFCCNDSVVTKKKSESVLNDANAYLLFYEKNHSKMTHK